MYSFDSGLTGDPNRDEMNFVSKFRDGLWTGIRFSHPHPPHPHYFTFFYIFNMVKLFLKDYHLYFFLSFNSFHFVDAYYYFVFNKQIENNISNSLFGPFKKKNLRLPIPKQVWTGMGLDFIPKCGDGLGMRIN